MHHQKKVGGKKSSSNGKREILLYFIGVSDNMQVWCIKMAFCEAPFLATLGKDGSIVDQASSLLWDTSQAKCWKVV